MDKDVKQSADFYGLVAWAHANRKQLIWISAIVVIVGGGIGIYNLYKSNREAEANTALSDIKPLSDPDEQTNAAAADPYIKVAASYSGTGAAARACLLAGDILFQSGKYQEAQQQFSRFLSEYPDYPLADQALIGIAKSYEAQGNLADAATRYKDFVDHHPASSALQDARSSLARVYLAQNKPELALQEYEQLLQGRNNDSWTAEAGSQREELLEKYPNLKKVVAPPPTAAQQFTMPTNAPAPHPAATTPAPTGPAPVNAAPTNAPTHAPGPLVQPPKP